MGGWVSSKPPPLRSLVGFELASAELMPVASPPEQAPCGGRLRKWVHPLTAGSVGGG